MSKTESKTPETSSAPLQFTIGEPEQNVPIPEKSVDKWKLSSLEIGDSIKVSLPEDTELKSKKRVRSSISSSIQAMHRNTKKKFMLKTIDDRTFRYWRTE